MDREKLKLIVAILALFGVAAVWIGDRPIAHPPGVLAQDEPQQQVPADDRAWDYEGYRVTPRADYSLKARVLSASRYRWDRGSALAPVDLAVGWGSMSDSSTLDRFEVEQGSRYFTLYPQDGRVDLAEALRHAANMHVIPANAQVRRALDAAKPGSVVTMRGRLVDVRGADGFTWNTSLRRDDTGDGACELFWADEIELQ
jgi:hypothetical protein